MEIGKATITPAAATAWYQYNNAAAASSFCASTKTCDKKAFKIEKQRLYLHCLVQGRTPHPPAGTRTKLSYFKADIRNC